MRLGPGIFLTKGITVSGKGWAVPSGLRILGSGANATTLKLLNPDGADRCAIGMRSVPTVPLDGFEASDFTIDLNFSGAGATPGAANRAVFLYGRHLYFKRLRITNFGGTTSGQIIVLQAAAVQTEDSVVEECTIEPGSSIGNATCVLAGFGGNSGNPHDYCGVRNCFLRGLAGGTGAIHGIMPGCGRGFIAEGNDLIDLASGVYDPPHPPGMEIGRDIILRHNYFRNVLNGINYSGRAHPLHRMIVHDNVMDVQSNGTGIALLGKINPVIYTALIIRKNIIRSVNWDSSPPGAIAYGISVSRVQDLVVQHNIINNAAIGVTTSMVMHSTVNNNINTQGKTV